MNNLLENLAPDLTDQIALVTGASRGIGKAIANALGACGAHVILAARSATALDALAVEIQASGGKATPVVTDVSRPESIASLFEAVDSVADKRLDILINNAGIGAYGDVVDVKADDLDRMYEVNVRGPFLTCQAAMQRMMPARSGTIINIASVVGLKGYPRQGGYTATKHALVGLTKSLTSEAQPHGIRVSVICPGGVDTDLVAQARPDLDRSILMKPDDIARTTLYLLALPERAWVDSIYIRRATSSPW
jgi:3-oxoacyl-[acyl-carrier protein] reductase